MRPLLYEKLLALSCLWLLGLQVSVAQTTMPEDILSRYEKYPVEKVFLLPDKAEYLAGEPIQFKAYIISRGRLSAISTNLYVELLDADKKVVAASKTPVRSGVSEGYFQLPADLPEQVYFIRAYTSWMLNFDEALQFIRPLHIYNNGSTKKLSKAAAAWTAELKPEGGNWLAYTHTKVAVRLRTVGRLPDTVRGYLFEGTDSLNKLADIHFFNNEIGRLVLAPLPGKTYKVLIADDEGNREIIDLPSALEQGVALKLTGTAGFIAYSLQAKGISDQLKGCRIVAYNKGQLLFSGMIPTAKEKVEGKIPVDHNTTGVVHIAIFDPAGKLLAERLCFADNGQLRGDSPTITTIIKSEAPKGLNRFTVHVPDTANKHTWLAEITNGETPVAWPGESLVTAFYFEDLPQLPLHAKSYMNTEDSRSKEALDYLLMSESRGLYDWTYLLAHPVPAIPHFPDNYITYKGKITLGKKPVTNETATILLNLNDTVNIVRTIKTDDKGAFVINKIFFRDSAKAYFHLHKKTRFDDLYEISFSEQWDTLRYTLPLPATGYKLAARRDDGMNERVRAYSQALSDFDLGGVAAAKTLETVKIQATRNLTKELDKELSTPLFSDVSEVILDFVNQDQDAGGFLLLDYLNGRLPGVTVNPGEAPQFRGGTVALYLDEMQADVDMINTMPMQNIAMVKFLRNSFALGAPNGVLAVYTKRGKLLTNTQYNSKPAKFQLLIGYPPALRFNTADYSKPGVSRAGTDTRSIWLWKPVWSNMLRPIDFYNNDSGRPPQIILTGLDQQGRPFCLQQKF